MGGDHAPEEIVKGALIYGKLNGSGKKTGKPKAAAPNPAVTAKLPAPAPAGAKPAKTDSTKPESTKPESTKPESTKPESKKPASAAPKPATSGV